MSNGQLAWIRPEDPPESFPPIHVALDEPDGLLAAGGDLAPDRLLWAYRHGIFPWYDDGQPLLWWSPNPRCLFLPGDFHTSRRLNRWIQTAAVEVRVSTAFAEVIRACAAPRLHQRGTWITPEMIAAYSELHELGWAHSIEIWDQDELCGGLYGIAIGRAFFGESMFSAQNNASKVALKYLDGLLDQGILEFVDCQVVSPHLLSLGARTIPRQEFSERLTNACPSATRLMNWPRWAP